MLRIVQSTSAAAAKKYFSESLNRPDYYGQDGQSPGLWFGDGAKRLGLKGQVSGEDFFALADNKHPESGKRLTVRDVADRRPGSDFVFSPPKSVSALWARTGDERILEAFRASVQDTLKQDIEPAMKTRLRRNGQNSDVVTGNIVGAMFLHTETRPGDDLKPDPHIHIHAYVMNLTFAEHEKRWQAAQLYDLHIDRPYLEAAFESRLARRLEELGLPIERRAEGWEVAGVPRTVIDKFSRRTAEVEAEAKKRGITDAAKKAELGAKTRRRKQDGMDAGQLQSYWDSRLTEAERFALDKVWRSAATGGEGSPSSSVTADQAMEHAVGHVFARDSAVSEKLLLAEALRYGVGSILPEDAKHQLSGHRLIAADIDGRRVVTTEQVLAEEQAMVEFAREGRGRCESLGQGHHAFRRNLDAGQQAIVHQLLQSHDRVMMLIGKAGVGKTTALRELADALEEQGQRLIAVAPSARASRGVLREKGFASADTVAAMLRSEEMQQQVRGNVILVDEAGLAGTKALGEVFDLAAKQDARVLVVGDPQQHRGVPRGSVLRILQDHAGLEPVRLTKIRRQEDPGYREAIEALSEEGRTATGFDRLDGMGFIKEIAEPEERYRQLASDYANTLEAGHTALIVAPTHAEGRRVSEAVREELRHRGRLGAEDHMFVRYESKGLTEAQRADAVQFQPGDMVQWHQHAPGFKSGDRVEVVESVGGMVQVRDGRGEIRTLPLQHAGRFELYRTTSLPVAEGDRLRVSHNGYTSDGKKHRLNNGDLMTVAGFTPEGDIIDHRGWRIGKHFSHLAHGIITSHASQGMDEDYCFVAQSTASLGATSAQQFYVSASRGKLGLRVYSDDKEALRKAVLRSEQSGTATKVWRARQAQKDAAAREALTYRQRRRRYLDAMKSMRDKAVRRLKEAAANLRGRFHAGDDRQKEISHAQS